MSYTKKRIDVAFSLGKGSFGETGANTITVSGLRVIATITTEGGNSMGHLLARIYGMTQSQMNQLSTLGLLITELRKNSVALSAGDYESGMSEVFVGTITNAYVDFDGAPQVSFNVEASVGALEAVKPVPPSSYPGATDVALIMSGLAKQMGLRFQNWGVSVKLASPYYAGTGRDQIIRCAEAANINWIIENNRLDIWPKNAARGSTVPVISPETGMVGYPAYDSLGIILRTLFNPTIAYGSDVMVKSSLQPACGTWRVYHINHSLASETPGGEWFSTMKAARPGSVPIA